MKIQNNVIIIAVLCTVLLFSIDIQKALAVPSIMTITYNAGTTHSEGAYVKLGLASNEMVSVGAKAGNATLFIKNHNSATSGSDVIDTEINLFFSQSGATSAHTIVFVDDISSWWIFTNIGAVRMNLNHVIVQTVSSGAISVMDECVYNDERNVITCIDTAVRAVYEINPNTMDITQTISYTVMNTPSTFALDETSGFSFVTTSCTAGTPCIKSFDMATGLERFTINGVAGCLTNQGVSVDTDKDFFWISCSDSNTVKKYTQGGSLSATITSLSTPRFQEIDSVARRLYVAYDVTDQIQIFDIDSNTALNTLGVCDYQNQPLDVRRQNNDIKVYIPCAGTTGSQLVDDSSAVFPLSDTEEYCSIADNEDTLACFEPEPLTQSADLVQDGIFDLMVATGIITGADTNCKTNGVGYMYVTASILIMVGIMWVASRGDLTNIPTFIWFLSTLAILGAVTTIGCLDTTFFIVGILIIVALAVAKVKSVTFGEYFKGE